MRIKGTLVFACMVLGLAAFASSASAVEQTIVDNNVDLVDKDITFTGTASFESAGTGIECEVKAVITANGAVTTVKEFAVINPTTSCKFFGAVYETCEFEQHPSVLENAPLTVDITNEIGTVTSGTKSQPHGLITGEIKTKTAAHGALNCEVTTNDLTVVYEPAAVPATVLTADIETNAAGFVTALKLTGQIRVDRGTVAQGTTTPVAEARVGVNGTLHIEAAEENTYKVANTP